MKNNEKRVATFYDYTRFLDALCGEPCVDCPASSFKNGLGCSCNELRKNTQINLTKFLSNGAINTLLKPTRMISLNIFRIQIN